VDSCGEDVSLTIVDSLLETGNFADATIICVKKEWKVHKTILCPRSKWFADAFDDKNQACCSRLWAPLLASTACFFFANAYFFMQEGQTGIVNLHDWTEEDMDTMLRFIYSGGEIPCSCELHACLLGTITDVAGASGV